MRRLQGVALLAGGLGLCGNLFGAYVYDYSQSPVIQDSARWSANGSPLYQSWGVGFSSTGSLISIPAISGANSNDYEVNTTLAIKSGGGTFIQFFRASSGTAVAGSGSYISVELAVPTGFTSPGAATLTVNQCAEGTITTVSTASITATDAMNVRGVVFGTNLWVFVNNELTIDTNVTASSGNPGIGGTGMSSGSGFSGVKLGPHDVVAPQTVSLSTVATSILPYQVNIRWQGVQDDPNGVGLCFYWILRNGSGGPSGYGPELADNGVQPGQTYSYQIAAVDYHGNYAWTAPFNVTTPPAQAIDPRRVGVSALGSYWGGGGEQIDTRSGNVNYSLPLVTAQGRTSWTVPVGLSYNSQNWRNDGGTNWQLGDDVGYGFGWRAQVGSVTPYYTGIWYLGVDHYVYTDGSGAEYRLDQNNNGVWSSTQGVYVWFDANANVLHFKDGTFWTMGCTSGGTEADAGTLYPTVLEDVNGNQVIVAYLAGAGLAAASTNTSARISTIEDVRGNGRSTYTFTWTSDSPTPHLAGITNSVGTAENFSFTYAKSVTLEPAFGNDPLWTGQTTTQLASLMPMGNGAYLPGATPLVTSYVFTYDTQGASELLQATLPYGGHLRWTYGNDSYSGSRMLRAVTGRYLAADSGGATEWSYGISRDNASSATIHATMTLADASGVGAKTWNFITPASASFPWQVGLITSFVQSSSAGGTVLQRDDYGWSLTPQEVSGFNGSPYISTKTTTMNPGTGNSQAAYSTQSLDQYGNATAAAIYPYNSTSTPLRTYSSSYATSPTYISHYIRNRLLTTTMTMGTTTKTLVTNQYDGCAAGSQPAPPCGSQPNTPYGYQPPTTEIDSSPVLPFNSRGLLTTSTTPARATSMSYYSYGGFASGSASDGTTVTASADPGTNYAAPQSIATQSYSQTVSYNAWLGVTQATGANGEQLSMSYDPFSGRPTSGTSPYGAVTTYSYSASEHLPAAQTQSGPTGVTTTTLDGMGRPISVVTNGAETDRVYAPCACSPLGKIQKVSAPYATGGSPAGWTTYAYDGLGRTLSVLQPDGVSTTYTSYSGNQTTVTDPVGKTKTFTSDVQGNLTTVAEPDPCVSGNTLTTSYTYDWMNHLSGVTMTRPGTTWTGAACTETGSPATQTRTFVYDDAGRLTSAANPENGKVTYSYNNDNTLSSKLDANGHQTTYTYDGQKRVTGIQRNSDPCQQVTYSYDANPYDSTGTFQYTYGRLAAALYPVCSANTAGGPTPTVTEMYSYTPAGLATVKRLHIYLPFYDTLYGGFRDAWSDTQASFSYTGWGALSGMTLPAEATNNGSTTCSSCGWHTVPVTFYTGYDSAGRPDSMTDNDQNAINGSGRTWVENVAYDYAGRMTSSDTWTGIYDNRYYYFDPVNGWTCCNDYYTDVYNRETRAYNVNGQMTSQLWSSNGGGTSFPTATGNQYIYSPPGTPTPNNGQVMQEVKGSETVTYQYDALKRLISSSATPVTGSTPAAWTQTFQYDGFGNLTGKVLSGTATAIPVDNTTNRLTNATYDNNGNMLTGSVNGSGVTLGYDGANRMISATKYSGGTELYGYAPDNKRIVTVPADGSSPVWTLWGPQGQKLGDFNIVGNFVGSGVQTWSNFTGYVSVVGPTLYFAGRKIWEQGADGEWNTTAVNNGGSVVTDRLGSAGVYLPYGDTNGSAAGGRSFATYARGSLTGIDYADQRFYASTYGRFNSPDPSPSSIDPRSPLSWHRYSYVKGDPVNRFDPTGTWDGPPGAQDCTDDPDQPGCNDPCQPVANSVVMDPSWALMPNAACGEPDPAPEPGPVAAPTCGQQAASVMPDSAQGIDMIAVLFGEDSWSKIGHPTLANASAPSGSTVTSADVLLEEATMVKTMQNLAVAYGQSVEWTIQHNQYAGYKAGYQKFTDALDSAVGSSDCDHLFSAITALTVGPTLDVSYTQWRAAVQGGLVLPLGNGLRLAYSDFFTGPPVR